MRRASPGFIQDTRARLSAGKKVRSRRFLTPCLRSTAIPAISLNHSPLISRRKSDPSRLAEKTALGFVDALQRAYSHIARHPATGSPRYAHQLDLSGLRSWPMKRYPYLVFYVERDDHVDVWRVLRGERDIPAWMWEPGNG